MEKLFEIIHADNAINLGFMTITATRRRKEAIEKLMEILGAETVTGLDMGCHDRDNKS